MDQTIVVDHLFFQKKFVNGLRLLLIYVVVRDETGWFNLGRSVHHHVVVSNHLANGHVPQIGHSQQVHLRIVKKVLDELVLFRPRFSQDVLKQNLMLYLLCKEPSQFKEIRILVDLRADKIASQDTSSDDCLQHVFLIIVELLICLQDIMDELGVITHVFKASRKTLFFDKRDLIVEIILKLA